MGSVEKGKMWIDGEYFDDPVYAERARKADAISEISINMAISIVKAIANGAPEIVINIIEKSAKAQTMAIIQQPLFPHTVKGGIIGIGGVEIES